LAKPLPPRPFLYPVLDVASLGERSVGAVIAALARGGVRIVQLRAKEVEDRLLVELAREARDATRSEGVLFLVNDRPDVALIVGADGVHVGQDDLSPRPIRALLGADAIVGLSTHDLAQVAVAAGEPVDYVAIGPVFPTLTKARPDPVVGVELLRRARARVGLPLVAIGGITPDNARTVVEAGADGVAVISGLLAAPDLTSAALAFAASLSPGP
jgi:thiamine-phosphate pyrophosphorylase